jgi:hypothetical protein
VNTRNKPPYIMYGGLFGLENVYIIDIEM